MPISIKSDKEIELMQESVRFLAKVWRNWNYVRLGISL